MKENIKLLRKLISTLNGGSCTEFFPESTFRQNKNFTFEGLTDLEEGCTKRVKMPVEYVD